MFLGDEEEMKCNNKYDEVDTNNNENIKNSKELDIVKTAPTFRFTSDDGYKVILCLKE